MSCVEAMALLATVLLVLLLLPLLWKKVARTNGAALRLPPSPPSLPVIGHLHLIGKPAHHSMVELAKTYGELMFLKLGSLNTLVVSSPRAARLVLKTHDPSFAGRSDEVAGYDGAGIIFAQYGEHWRQVRKLCNLELLSSKRVEMARPHRKLETELLLKDLWTSAQAGEVSNLSEKLLDVVFNVIAKMVFNKSYNSSQAEREQAIRLKDVIKDVVRLINRMHLTSFFPSLRWFDRHIYKMFAAHKQLDEILQDELEQHRKSYDGREAPKDFLEVMLSIGGMTDATIKALSSEMIGAGTDTSSATVEWAISELVKHPEVMSKAQEELDRVVGRERTMLESDIPSLKYLKATVTETLRLHPPAGVFVRKASGNQPCQVGDYTVPAKTRVFINAYAIGRDASVWKEPCVFDPERFMADDAMDVKGQDFELLPFGAGRRMCPGIQLGLTNAMLMVGSLVHAFDWGMPKGDLDMREHFGITIPRVEPLELLPIARLKPELYESLAAEHLCFV